MNKTIFFYLVMMFLSLSVTAQDWISQVSGTTQDLNSIHATSATNVFLVGTNGTGLKTTDSGDNWSAMNIGSTNTQNSIRFLNTTTGFTVGDFQEIYRTTSSGNSWTFIGQGATNLNDGYFTSVNSGWVVGDVEVGFGFLYNPFTFNFVMIPATANKNLQGIYFANNNVGWVVGDGGLIIKTANFGNTWNQQTSGVTERLNKIMFLDVDNGVAIGNNGTIVRTTNGGANWDISPSGTIENLNSIYYSDASNIWACGDNGTIIRSLDGGVTWSAETSGVSVNLKSIHGFSAQNVWACGANGTIIYRNESLSIDEYILNKEDVIIYPNPTKSTLYFEVKNKQAASSYTLSIINLLGIEILRMELENYKGTINLDKLSAGSYFFRFLNEDNVVFTKKIIKE